MTTSGVQVSFVNVTWALYGSWHANDAGPVSVIESEPSMQASRMWRVGSLPQSLAGHHRPEQAHQEQSSHHPATVLQVAPANP